MKITLKQLVITNFKGIQSLVIDFTDITNVSGANGTGKTSIADAWNWLLFDKNATDAKDFSIKNTKDTSLNRLEHIVGASIETNDNGNIKQHDLRKIYREKWTKKRGNEFEEFTGHETDYYYNGTPVAKGEYNTIVAGIIGENIAKMITNPLYFNSLKWDSQRAILTSMVGTIDTSEVIAGNPQFEALVKELNGKATDKYKLEIAAKKKPIKEELDKLPTRIDEAEKSKPLALDYVAIEGNIGIKQMEIDIIDNKLQNVTDAHQRRLDSVAAAQTELHNMKLRLDGLKRVQTEEVNRERNGLQSQLNLAIDVKKNLADNTALLNNNISRNQYTISTLNEEKQRLVEEWKTVNTNGFVASETDTTCPTCKRALDNLEGKMLELAANFNTAKRAKLDAIEKRGEDIKAEITRLQGLVDADKKQLELVGIDVEKNQHNIDELKAIINISGGEPALPEPTNEMVSLQHAIDTFVIPTIEQPDNSVLKEEKTALLTELDTLKLQLATREQIKTANTRIEQLRTSMKQLSQDLASLEQKEFIIAAYDKANIELIETRVNAMFSIVKFKMFNTLINGGEEPTCECYVNGVPFSDANTASKINAGLDIINTISKYHGVFAPIFIDQKESVTEIIPMQTQIINLIVDPDEKVLKVVNN